MAALSPFTAILSDLQNVIADRNYSQKWSQTIINAPLALIQQVPAVGGSGGNIPMRRHSFPSVDDIGTRLVDLLRAGPSVLSDPDELVELSTYDQHARLVRRRVEKISIRVKILGPRGPYTIEKQVTVCSIQGNESTPHAKKKLATGVAGVVRDLFIKYGGSLDLGNAVSNGSWQPILAYF